MKQFEAKRKRERRIAEEDGSTSLQDEIKLESSCSVCCYEGCGECRYSTSSYCRDHHSIVTRMGKYGLTAEEVGTLLEIERCNICFSRFSDKLIRVIDHNHTTDEVRGVLCQKCNKALGLFQDNIWVLKQAIKYLEERGSYLDVPEEL